MDNEKFEAVLIGLIIANFIYAAFSGNWVIACDRSFFQFIAVGTCMFANWINKNRIGGDQ